MVNWQCVCFAMEIFGWIFIQLEKFLNVCVLQCVCLVEIHSMCVFSIFDGRFLMVDSFNVFVC